MHRTDQLFCRFSLGQICKCTLLLDYINKNGGCVNAVSLFTSRIFAQKGTKCFVLSYQHNEYLPTLFLIPDCVIQLFFQSKYSLIFIHF